MFHWLFLSSCVLYCLWVKKKCSFPSIWRNERYQKNMWIFTSCWSFNIHPVYILSDQKTWLTIWCWKFLKFNFKWNYTQFLSFVVNALSARAILFAKRTYLYIFTSIFLYKIKQIKIGHIAWIQQKKNYFVLLLGWKFMVRRTSFARSVDCIVHKRKFFCIFIVDKRETVNLCILC